METQPPFDFNLGLKKLNELIKGIRIAMLTTVSKDLTLHSSPLLAQEIEFYGDLWFLISKSSQKAEDLRNNHHVCISYASGARYISVTGTADLIDDAEKVQEPLHASDVSARIYECGHWWPHQNGRAWRVESETIEKLLSSFTFRNESYLINVLFEELIRFASQTLSCTVIFSNTLAV